MTDTDPDTRRITELLASFDAGPTPDLDFSYVTRRGTRMRTARQLEAAAAVLTVVAVVAGALMFLADSPGARRPDTPVGSSSASASVVRVMGTARDWRAAVEQASPLPGQIRHYDDAPQDGPFVSTDDAAILAGLDYVHEWFRYTSAGRTTAFIVTARWAQNIWDGLRAGCKMSSTNCYPERMTSVGPVIVENTTGRNITAASNLRPSGIVLTVTSMPYDVTAIDSTTEANDAVLPSGLNADQLIDLVTSLPEPVLGHPAPSPSASPSDVTLSPVLGSGAIPASPVVSVSPGERVPLGGTQYMTLNPSQECVLDSATPVKVTPGTNLWCKSLTDGNLAPGSVDLQTQGDASRLLVTGYYLGDGATTVMVGSGPSARVATIVRVNGSRGPVAYFANLPAGDSLSQPMTRPTGRNVIVHDAHGRVLASL